jgi:mannose-6-phosphate isomerase-like protein (cupin superfamily)
LGRSWARAARRLFALSKAGVSIGLPQTLAWDGGCRIKSAAKTGATTTEMHLRAVASLQVDLQDQGAINETTLGVQERGRRMASVRPPGVYATASTERECGSIGAMGDPRTAPYGSVRLTDVDTLARVDPGNPNINDGAFHLVRRHFDVQAFGVNAATGNAGDEMVEEHHEADDEENETNGHQELFVVMTGHALFTVDGEEIDAPAGTVVFVRDPALLRAARATADDTTIFMVGGPTGVPYTISRWEASLP